MRALIFGNSGSGKSTWARQLAAAHDLEHLDLDSLYWQQPQPADGPCPRPFAKVAADLDAFRAAHPRWVVEGCYSDCIAHLAPHCSSLQFLNPGEAACLAHAAARPWEPHKYADPAAQQANLDMLRAWISDYYRRPAPWSLAEHRVLFDGFEGNKLEWGASDEQPLPYYVAMSERLVLQPLTARDAAFLVALLNTPGFLVHIADRGVRTLEQALDYLRQGPQRSYAEQGFGLWRIGRRGDDAPLGIAGLLKRDFLETVDLGYALLPEHEGRGYAGEAARLCLKLAHEKHGMRRVLAIVNADNAPSISLLRRLGFVDAGAIRPPGSEKPLRRYARDLPGPA
ncbi:GNAT family N-acetyltransferase [Pseudomarimonas salicorniae]|uniref:GNAT family N-acetyltransferase n=1 Tax=Pseudomarimonas salicorniae TaxID=2933270 RepID=A0ABT0GD19_9GAMM|nr:GNAT family N-acetyltransferase [Lysobacter sp. CAU 1642]MCK7592232.1 GNAT family N-acetyltransferase [Lysobacter sp. CAU 1642]